jgi:hypothetical protein
MSEWLSGCGRLYLRITAEQASCAYHAGQCDADVRTLSGEEAIRSQLTALDPALVREELKRYAARDEGELADHGQNLQRLLWLAAADIVEGNL